MENKINWGILATGRIAQDFVNALKIIPEANILAVGSRTYEKAEEFANINKIERVYGSYEQLVNDKDIDVIYVATPHPLHKEHCALAINAQKAVLCEKPFTTNSKDTLDLIKLSLVNNVFIMEAMWTRFLPSAIKVMEIIKNGDIGDIKMVVGDFCFRAEFDKESRIFNKELGGGALLDIGIYLLSYTSMIFEDKKPTEIKSIATIGESDVDENTSISLKYDDAIVSLRCSISANRPGDFVIYGTKGVISISEFWRANKFELEIYGGIKQTYDCDFIGNGYAHEAIEVMKCLQKHKIDNKIMPLKTSLMIMQTLDIIMEQIHQ